jgi:hypothetical protein
MGRLVCLDYLSGKIAEQLIAIGDALQAFDVIAGGTVQGANANAVFAGGLNHFGITVRASVQRHMPAVLALEVSLEPVGQALGAMEQVQLCLMQVGQQVLDI